jgi:hypothetical protein
LAVTGTSTLTGAVTATAGVTGPITSSSATITGGSITGITDLAVADGGTGASTAAAALNNLLPSQTSAASKYLQSDGTNASWDAVSLSTADITGTLGVANGGTGQTSFTDGQLLIGNSTGNTLTKTTLTAGSGVTITNGSGAITVAFTGPGAGSVTSVAATVPSVFSISGSPITSSGTLAMTYSGTALPNTSGGTGQNSAFTQYGVTYASTTSALATTAAGTAGYVLTANASAAPTFQAPSTSGTVTSVAATVPSIFSVAGSPITTSGTLAMTYSGTALPAANGGTGQTSFTDGQLLIGNTTGNTLTKAALTAGAGVSITNGSGSITIAASGGAGSNIFLAQTFGGF